MRIELEGCAIFGFGLGGLAALRQKGAESDARLGTVGVEALHRNVFFGGALELRALVGGEASRWNCREHRGRFDPHGAHRVRQQRLGEPPTLVGIHAFDPVQRAEPHQGVGVGEPAPEVGEQHRRQITRHLGVGGGDCDARSLRVGHGPVQQTGGLRQFRTRRMKGLGKVLEAFALRRIPALDRSRAPFGRFVPMAVVTGVGCPQPERSGRGMRKL